MTNQTMHSCDFKWDDKAAYMLCKCGLREALCYACHAPIGGWDGTGPLPFCNDQCRAIYARRTSSGPRGFWR